MVLNTVFAISGLMTVKINNSVIKAEAAINTGLFKDAGCSVVCC